jgi:hypothetical protein
VTRLRQRKAALGLIAAIALIVIVALQSRLPDLQDPDVLGSKIEKGPVVDAPCDIDGVRVRYDASYQATPTTAGYRVVSARVSEVAPTCVGATVTVRLTAGGSPVATGTASATSMTVPVTFPTPPIARDVNGVHVEIAGGTTPVPSECAGMAFDQFRALSPGNDTHAGSKDRDLVYGLEGNDTLRGDNQADCLVGQTGNDQLFGDNHADVLTGGAGNDILDGGNHDDVLHGGDGNDTLRGGNGRDECRGGGGTNTYVSCEVQL